MRSYRADVSRNQQAVWPGEMEKTAIRWEFEECEILDNSLHEYTTIELDPDLLSTPFRIQTNWHVITGAPCCGKTTLIDQLADKGFRIVPEIERQYIEREMARGRTINEIRENEVNFARSIKDMQLGIELGLRPTETTFLDRAFPDCLSYYRVAGLNPNQILLDCFDIHARAISR